MKIHRFIGDYNLQENEIYITEIRIIKQIRGVLRIKVGGHIILSDGKGGEEEYILTQISKDKIVCNAENNLSPVNSKTTTTSPTTKNTNTKQVNLYLAILKKENFELAVQKSVECGVSEIIPIITERTIKTGLNIPRLGKIIREASEQCGQNIVPKLHEIMSFEQALEHAKNADQKIIFHTKDAKEYSPNKNARSSAIFIGPEGGFTDKEIALADENNFISASLGNLILRGETAAIIATYRAVHEI